MLIPEKKIYSDGSHYIAIPHTTRPKQRRKNKPVVKVESTVPKPPTKKDIFDELYKDNLNKPKSELKSSLINSMREHFDTDKETKEFVEQQLERKKRNDIVRRTRLFRKVHLQTWNWFCTFTYNDELHTEDSFRKVLSNCLSHLSNRKEWKYIGVWERSPTKQRLHFHGIFYIPDNAMVGDLIEVSDYDTVAHRKQTTLQNTYFNERFGRSDFKEINNFVIDHAVMYLIKYLEKSGERLLVNRIELYDDEIIVWFNYSDRNNPESPDNDSRDFVLSKYYIITVTAKAIIVKLKIRQEKSQSDLISSTGLTLVHHQGLVRFCKAKPPASQHSCSRVR